MPLLIKTNKYDFFIDEIRYKIYFIHQLFFVLSASALARDIGIIYKITIGLVMLTCILLMLVAFYKLLRGNFSICEIGIYAFISIVLCISFYNYHSPMFIMNVIAIASFKDTNGKKVLWHYFYATVLGFLINFFLYLFTSHKGIVIQDIGSEQRIRNGLGFYYALLTQYYYMSLVMVYMILKEKFKFYEYIVILLLNYILYKYTDTRAPFFLTILMLVVFCVYSNFKNKILHYLLLLAAVLAYPVAFLVAYFTAVLYSPDNKFWSWLNNIVSGRLYLTKEVINEYGFKFFGQNVPIGQTIADTSEYMGKPVDSSMLRVLLLNGLLVLIVSLVFMVVFSYLSCKTKKYSVTIVLIFVALRSIFDLGFLPLQLSPVIFMFMPTLNKFLNIQKTNNEKIIN